MNRGQRVQPAAKSRSPHNGPLGGPFEGAPFCSYTRKPGATKWPKTGTPLMYRLNDRPATLACSASGACVTAPRVVLEPSLANTPTPHIEVGDEPPPRTCV